MNLPVLKIAVVGHTNTGKTSLLRTLTRDEHFGDVSDRPAVTRHVEGTALMIEDQPAIELYDTPGLEDSTGLLDQLDSFQNDRQTIGIEQIRSFLQSPDADSRFTQEAKAIRQLLNCHVALYVIDARDRLLGKHRDELEILSRSARPIVPVLNYLASDQARVRQWRQHLAELNLHAVAEFDTVVFDVVDEIRLFEKIRTLVDEFAPTIDAFIADRRQHYHDLIDESARLVAEMLIDIAAYVVRVPRRSLPSQQAGEETTNTTPTDPAASLSEPAVEAFKQHVRKREEHCVRGLLALFRFDQQAFAADELPISDGQWGVDLFNPAAMKEYGIKTGGGAAAGAVAGATIDVMLGGLSLGAATAAGAAIGGALSFGATQARRLVDAARGHTELRVNDATIELLARRELALVQALLRRGHASQTPIQQRGLKAFATGLFNRDRWSVPDVLAEARLHETWSTMRQSWSAGTVSNARSRAVKKLARQLRDEIKPRANTN